MSLKDQFDELPEGVESSDVKELRDALIRVQKQLQKQKQRTDELVTASYQAAYDAMLSMGKVKDVTPPVIDKRKHKGEVALWHMTDWQGAKKTASYNSEVMRDRVKLERAEVQRQELQKQQAAIWRRAKIKKQIQSQLTSVFAVLFVTMWFLWLMILLRTSHTYRGLYSLPYLFCVLC
jgi:uncharacterized protein (DUF2267 family)